MNASTLADLVEEVVSLMPMLPVGVGREVVDRLPDIVEAIGEGLLRNAAIVLAFDDLGDEAVVLTVILDDQGAHIDVTTNAEALVISNGYDLAVCDGSGGIRVDRTLPHTQVDHGGRIGLHLATERATARLAVARSLMATHTAFQEMTR